MWNKRENIYLMIVKRKTEKIVVSKERKEALISLDNIYIFHRHTETHTYAYTIMYIFTHSCILTSILVYYTFLILQRKC